MHKKITRALISVSDKQGILEFARFLVAQGVELLSTGGTAKLLRDAGLAVKEVSEHTGFPEMLDGRVKTLHPTIHGGILGIRDNKDHQAAMSEHAIAPIDMVVINLYPFEATVAKGAGFEECIENIDIGGPAMVRSSAKNHEDVVILVDAGDYARVQEEMTSAGGTTLALRRDLAAKAYAHTAAYDSAISGWFARQLGQKFPAKVSLSGTLKQILRYGENPHQEAAFYSVANAEAGVATARQVQGKELSYNNINDTDAAFTLVSEFTEPAVAIIKHANPCGVARGASLAEAYKQAYACDPVSAYGGIVALNRPLDAATMQEISNIFVEVIIAPEVDDAALALLEKKKNLRLLLTGVMPAQSRTGLMVRPVSGGFLLQDADAIVTNINEVKCVTKTPVSDAQMQDLLFAFTVCKHVKSNAIVMAKDLATVGIGAGQMSRVNSVRIACIKAEEAGLTTRGAVLASDAFFPFSDNVELAAQAGISAIIQPGGSIRDEEVIAAADKHGIGMVFTGIRHFLH